MFFQNIQAMRGIASLLVFFAHLVTMDSNLAPDWAVYYGFYLFGPSGVDIFFVISGFVVTLTAFKQSKNESKSKLNNAFDFIIKRIIRIYPLYWLVLIIAYLVSPPISLSPDWLPKASDIQIITLTYPINYKIMAAWTLVYEMFFYCILSVLIICGSKKFFPILFLWIFVEILFIAIFGSIDRKYSDYVPLNPQIFQFCIGSLVAYILVHFNPKYGKQTLYLGCIMFIAMCYVNVNLGSWDSPYNRALTLTLPSAMIIYGAAVSEKEGTFKFNNILMWFGNISFSLYLWHQILFYILKHISISMDIELYRKEYWFLVYILFGTIAISISYISYIFIENKFQKMLVKLFIRD